MKNLVFVFFLLISGKSFALFEAQGKVTGIVASGGKIIFTVCNNDVCNKFWIVPDEGYNQAVFSMILSAKLTDRLIWIGGSDTPDVDWPYSGARAFSAMDFKG